MLVEERTGGDAVRGVVGCVVRTGGLLARGGDDVLLCAVGGGLTVRSSFDAGGFGAGALVALR